MDVGIRGHYISPFQFIAHLVERSSDVPAGPPRPISCPRFDLTAPSRVGATAKSGGPSDLHQMANDGVP